MKMMKVMIEWVGLITFVFMLGVLFRLGLVYDDEPQEQENERVHKEPQLFDLKADVVE